MITDYSDENPNLKLPSFKLGHRQRRPQRSSLHSDKWKIADLTNSKENKV